MTSTHNAPENSRIRRRILDTVKRTIAEYEMVGSGTSLLVGVSGGPNMDCAWPSLTLTTVCAKRPTMRPNSWRPYQPALGSPAT